MNRSLFYFFLGWHFLCVLVYNVSSTVKGYRQLAEVPGSGYVHRAERITIAVNSWPPVRTFARYAGTATGYGFFAPQVGSSFLLEVSILDNRGTVQATTHAPLLKQAHSLLRYHSLLGRMQHLLADDTRNARDSSLTLRQARAIAHCLAQRTALQRWGATGYNRIRCEVYAYTHDHRVPIYRKDLDPLPAP